MKTLIKNAKIYDGSGATAYMGQILIDGDRIERIGPAIDAPADRVIDLQGKSAASGFIDGHSHNDWFAIKKNPLPYFEPFIRQGITTFVAGNCGVSAIGFEEGCQYVDKLGGGLFDFQDTTGRYGTVDQLFAAVDEYALQSAGTCRTLFRPGRGRWKREPPADGRGGEPDAGHPGEGAPTGGSGTLLGFDV